MAVTSNSRAAIDMAGLDSAIEREMLRPFHWGENDCCLAACNVLASMGFGDAAAAYRGRYSDEPGACLVMAGTTEEVAEREAARIGWPEINPADARDCDVGVVGHSLAIFSGGWWNAKSMDGVVMKRRVRRAWRPA